MLPTLRVRRVTAIRRVRTHTWLQMHASKALAFRCRSEDFRIGFLLTCKPQRAQSLLRDYMPTLPPVFGLPPNLSAPAPSGGLNHECARETLTSREAVTRWIQFGSPK